MCGTFRARNVISISYGSQESDVPAYYQKRQCNEFMKLGLQGVTVIFASGDSGVAAPLNHGTENGCINSVSFSPGWPQTCPYVTTVGATKVMPGKSVTDPEWAVNDNAGQPFVNAFSSGGGFSNIYPIPAYQAKAVKT
jgi:tripeptidyl-peptidase-1